MKRNNDSSKFTLFMEPLASEKANQPVIDGLTILFDNLIRKHSTEGTSNYGSGDAVKFDSDNGYRGVHTTDCGEYSSNVDYLLDKGGFVLNSLAPFYLAFYRDSITGNDWANIREIVRLYKDEFLRVSVECMRNEKYELFAQPI